ncbi:unnamed protein product [Mucor hiemalis]
MANLVISKQHILGPCELRLDVYQELGGYSKDSTTIGSLTINLSEYAGSGLTTRRYLLDDCKFNSTIKLSIKVDQKSDTLTQFDIPPLKKQQVFTDIPQMIIERQERSDERSLHSANTANINNNAESSSNSNSNNNFNAAFRPQTPIMKKSQSVVSLVSSTFLFV